VKNAGTCQSMPGRLWANSASIAKQLWAVIKFPFWYESFFLVELKERKHAAELIGFC